MPRHRSQSAFSAVMIMCAATLLAGAAIRVLRVEMDSVPTGNVVVVVKSTDGSSGASDPARLAPSALPRPPALSSPAEISGTPSERGERRAASSIAEIEGEIHTELEGKPSGAVSEALPSSAASLLVGLRRQLACIVALPTHLLALYFLGCLCLVLFFRGLWAETRHHRCARRDAVPPPYKKTDEEVGEGEGAYSGRDGGNGDEDDESDEIDLVCAVNFDAARVMPLIQNCNPQPAHPG